VPHVTITAKEQETVPAPPELVDVGRLNLYPQVTKKNYFQAKITTDGLTIQAGNHIGSIPLNDDVTLQVEPRVPLGNLARLLTTINHTGTALPGLLRHYDTEPGVYPSLVALYAASLRSLIAGLGQDGLLRRYFERHQDYAAPRGRINVGRTLQTALPRGLPHVSSSYFERSVDTPENRALLAAVMWLHRYATRYATALAQKELRQIRRDLNEAAFLLRGVTHDQEHRFVSDAVVTGRQPLPALRQRYRPALDLAMTIINQQAVIIEKAGKRLELDTLLIDMERVFESYVREVLRREAKHGGWPEVIVDGNFGPPKGAASKLFKRSAEDDVPTTPDIVCERSKLDRNRHPVILDAKYRPVRNRVERKDLEQVLLYGLAYKAPHVVVVQPVSPGGRSGLHTSGEVEGITVHVYGYDLAGDLDAVETDFAATTRGLCASVPR
jgi:5-methylcytosine-specific restriction enzyme subunit McrC